MRERINNQPWHVTLGYRSLFLVLFYMVHFWGGRRRARRGDGTPQMQMSRIISHLLWRAAKESANVVGTYRWHQWRTMSTIWSSSNALWSYAPLTHADNSQNGSSYFLVLLSRWLFTYIMPKCIYTYLPKCRYVCRYVLGRYIHVGRQLSRYSTLSLPKILGILCASTYWWILSIGFRPRNEGHQLQCLPIYRCSYLGYLPTTCCKWNLLICRK